MAVFATEKLDHLRAYPMDVTGLASLVAEIGPTAADLGATP